MSIPNSNINEKQENRAFVVTIVFLIASIANLILSLSQGFQTNAWQHFVRAALVLTFGIATIIAAIWIRRGRTENGIWLLIVGFLFALTSTSLLFAGFGLILAVVELILAGGIAAFVLPKRKRNRAFIVSAISAVLTFGFDFLPLNYRIPVPVVLKGALPAIAGIVILIVGLYISRQVWGRSMRNNLLIAFIGVTVVSTGTLGIIAVVTTTNNLQDALERELTALAVDRATRVGDLFNEQINTLTTLSLSEALQNAVESQNITYTYEGDSTTIQATLDKKDAQWRAAAEANDNSHPLVQGILTNGVARELLEYQQVFPSNVETFITDVYGGLAGTTNRTSDYNQADESWWQAAYANGEGAVYIGNPEYDESAGSVGVNIALPIRKRETGDIIGILRTTYVLSPLETILADTIGETGSTDLFVPGENGTQHIHEGGLKASVPGLFEQLQEVYGQGMVELVYEDELSVVTQAPVRTLEGNPDIDNLGWVVAFHQHRDEAFVSINSQIQGTILVMVFVVALAAAAAYGLSVLMARPVIQLTKTAEEVSAGNFGSRAEVTTSDEIGTLATAFNSMTSQLQETLEGLEQRVAERTQNLELAAEVGRSVSQVRELDVMLKDACDLILKEFDLYYVQVYLTAPNKRNLILEAGTGEVGAQLRERGHSLQLNINSINGRAAVEKHSVVISNTAESEVFHPNPLLPETRGEMAVPLIVGDKVVGVLDMQSSHPDMLTEEVLPAFEALAGQLAVAIQNANLVAEAEQARAEVEAQARRLVRTGWGEFMDAIHKPEQVGFVFAQNDVTPLVDAEDVQFVEEHQSITAPISLTGEMLGSLVVEVEEKNQNEQTSELVNIVARQVAQHIENLRLLESAERFRFEAEQAARRQTREGWQEYLNARSSDSLGYLYDLKKVYPYSNGKDHSDALTLPLKVRDEAIGKLTVQGLSSDDSEAVELANAVAERLGAHIESLRQYDRTQSALAQSERLFSASSRLTQATGLQELVAAAVTTLEIPVVNRALLTTFDYDAEGEVEQLNVIANWWSGEGQEVTPIGTRYPLEVVRAMPMFVSPIPVFFNDAFNDERVDETTMQLVKRLNLRAVAVLPLHLGSQQIGALLLEAEEPHNFTPDETRLFESLAPQIATVLENRQQYERAQRQAERESMLNTINQKIQSANSVEAVLQIAARELGHALGAPMTIAQLSMKDKN